MLQETPPKAANPIASAITLVREQLIIVEDMLENYRTKENSSSKPVNPTELKNLRNTKNEMERQIGQLLLMARSEEEDTVILHIFYFLLLHELNVYLFLNLTETAPQRCDDQGA